jgi:hypothetical protein
VTRFLIRGHRTGAYDIAVTGPLDQSTTKALRCLLKDLAGNHVTLDLTECGCMTDEAHASLAAASRQAELHGGALRVHPAHPLTAA